MNGEATEVPEGLLAAEVRAICNRYRIDEDAAREILERHFARRPGLVREIAARHPAEDVTRLAAYKRAIKDARKQIYYHLRQYRRDAAQRKHLEQALQRLHPAAGADRAQAAPLIDALLQTHVSTRERASCYDAFYRQLFGLVAPPRSILDVGCGLHPLSYPFDAAATRPEVYLALDRAPDVIETVRLFAPHAQPARLVATCADLADVRWGDHLPDGLAAFDLAFLLKLVPVIHRTDRALLSRLAEAPARRLVVTASAEALTRKVNIRKREERVLKAFVALTGREVVGTLEVGNEFGYVLA